jgi:hypothetical protein
VKAPDVQSTIVVTIIIKGKKEAVDRNRRILPNASGNRWAEPWRRCVHVCAATKPPGEVKVIFRCVCFAEMCASLDPNRSDLVSCGRRQGRAQD